MKYNVLILGASYGSLFGTKLLLAGHSVTLVCTPPTAELISREGTVVRFPIRGRDTSVEICFCPCVALRLLLLQHSKVSSDDDTVLFGVQSILKVAMSLGPLEMAA